MIAPWHSLALLAALVKDVKLEPSYTAGRNAKQCSHFGKQLGSFSSFKTEFPYDPAIPLLGGSAVPLFRHLPPQKGLESCCFFLPHQPGQMLLIVNLFLSESTVSLEVLLVKHRTNSRWPEAIDLSLPMK